MDHDRDDQREHGTPAGGVPADAQGPEPTDGATRSDGASDPLLEVRAALDEVAQLPLDERADVFERTHRVVVDELRALELG